MIVVLSYPAQAVFVCLGLSAGYAMFDALFAGRWVPAGVLAVLLFLAWLGEGSTRRVRHWAAERDRRARR